MAKDYVEQRDEAYWIVGTRVSLDSVVYAFLEGLSPESIVDSFDTLTLEEVYGALIRRYLRVSLYKLNTYNTPHSRSSR